MPLFTDGPASTIEDLAAQDSQVLDVASVEGIDLTRKLALAQEAVAIDLEAVMRRSGNGPARLGHVVVTPALRLWHTYRTLELVYGDAYYNQLNDRYSSKRDRFADLGKWAHERLILTGIGIAPRPVPRAATPDVLLAAGSIPDGTYYVTMAWWNGAGEEGAAAIPAVVTTTGSGFQGFLVTPKPAPPAAAGWNVYAGPAPESMVRQNDQPLPPDDPWLQSQAVRSTGAAPGDGQAPSCFHSLPRVIQRG
jgi:hypothetical protein